MRNLSGHLSRRAQARLGASSLVYVEEDGSYTLERADTPPLGIGASASEAEASLTALHRAAGARDRGEPSE